MKLVAVGLALGIAVGSLLGRRLSQLFDLKPRYAPSALIGLLLQLVMNFAVIAVSGGSPRLATSLKVPGIQV